MAAKVKATMSYSKDDEVCQNLTCDQVHSKLNAPSLNKGSSIGSSNSACLLILPTSLRSQKGLQQPEQAAPNSPVHAVVQQGCYMSHTIKRPCKACISLADCLRCSQQEQMICTVRASHELCLVQQDEAIPADKLQCLAIRRKSHSARL